MTSTYEKLQPYTVYILGTLIAVGLAIYMLTTSRAPAATDFVTKLMNLPVEYLVLGAVLILTSIIGAGLAIRSYYGNKGNRIVKFLRTQSKRIVRLVKKNPVIASAIALSVIALLVAGYWAWSVYTTAAPVVVVAAPGFFATYIFNWKTALITIVLVGLAYQFGGINYLSARFRCLWAYLRSQ